MSKINENTVLEIDNLQVDFQTNTGMVHAVKGVNIHVDSGETVAIVGESGSGKSQTMMAAMGLLAGNGITNGEVRYRGQNILGSSIRDLNKIRGKKSYYDLPGAHDLTGPALHHRAAALRANG